MLTWSCLFDLALTPTCLKSNTSFISHGWLGSHSAPPGLGGSRMPQPGYQTRLRPPPLSNSAKSDPHPGGTPPDTSEPPSGTRTFGKSGCATQPVTRAELSPTSWTTQTPSVSGAVWPHCEHLRLSSRFPRNLARARVTDLVKPRITLVVNAATRALDWYMVPQLTNMEAP